MAIVNELVTAFSFKGNTNPLKDFNKELTTVMPKMTKLSLGMVGIGSLFAKFLTSSLIADNPLVQFANRTGESVKNIQALELASVKFGASLNSSLETTQNLSKALSEARLKGNEAFGQFGLKIIDESGKLKKTQDILKDINELFNSTNRVYGELADKRQKLIVLQTLGIKEDLLPLLMQTTAEYSKQIKISEQFTLSKEQIKSIKEFNNSLNETKTIVGQIASLVSADFGNSFKGITDGANDFLKTNKDIVLEISNTVLKLGLAAGSFVALTLSLKAASLAVGGLSLSLKAASLAVGGLSLSVKGLYILSSSVSTLFKGMFAPFTAFMLAFEAFESGAFSRLYNKLSPGKTIKVPQVRSPMPKDEQGRFLDVPLLESKGRKPTRTDPHHAINLQNKRGLSINGNVRGENVQKTIHQTNTFHISTDSPKVMSDVIENSVNKGIRLIQETSTRGGI